MTQDPKQIAAGLSEAQRADLLASRFTDDLAKLGLCWFRAAHIDFDKGCRTVPACWEWRGKGLAVRNILKENEDA